MVVAAAGHGAEHMVLLAFIMAGIIVFAITKGIRDRKALDHRDAKDPEREDQERG